MSAKSDRWKRAEKQLAEILKKHGINAERISRGSNYSVSTYDIDVKDCPELKCDSKYSLAGFKTSTLLEIIREKYCKNPEDKPVLFCKGYKEIGGKITIDVDFFAELLKCWISNRNV